MSVFVVLMLFLSEAQIAAALTCYCIDCTIGIECTGDQCYAQVVSGHVSVTTEHTYIYLFHMTVCVSHDSLVRLC